MKNFALLALGVVVVGGLLFWALSGSETSLEDSDVVAEKGIHWHPELAIYMNGEKQEIPANVGLIGGHQPIHTHVEDVMQDVLHFEFDSVVRTDDIRLKNFFRIWGEKDIQTAFGTLERMTVNGEDSVEFGEYVVQSEDKIELFYKSEVSE